MEKNQNNEPVWSVSEVNAAIKEMVENSLSSFWLCGEVSNLTLHRSGHVYLSLKDSRGQIRAVHFNGTKTFREAGIEVGSKIEVFGRLTVWEARGEYQFSISRVRLAGVGDIQKRFEELKRKLLAEGLFDHERKKPLPVLPKRIGVVTSPTGAAMRDFLRTLERRFPNLNVRIYPALVQGAAAAASVAAGIRFFNRTDGADVIIVTRGGGSMEDLWPFNEEVLVREVAASRIPVVSAVGHEIDFSLCDFAADLRVATPTAAAELVVGERDALLDKLDAAANSLQNLARCRALERKSRLAELSRFFRPGEIRHLLENQMMRADDFDSRMRYAAGRTAMQNRAKLDLLGEKLAGFEVSRQLARGYAILSGADGRIIRSSSQKPGTVLTASLADGKMQLEVK